MEQYFSIRYDRHKRRRVEAANDDAAVIREATAKAAEQRQDGEQANSLQILEILVENGCGDARGAIESMLENENADPKRIVAALTMFAQRGINWSGWKRDQVLTLVKFLGQQCGGGGGVEVLELFIERGLPAFESAVGQLAVYDAVTIDILEAFLKNQPSDIPYNYSAVCAHALTNGARLSLLTWLAGLDFVPSPRLIYFVTERNVDEGLYELLEVLAPRIVHWPERVFMKKLGRRVVAIAKRRRVGINENFWFGHIVQNLVSRGHYGSFKFLMDHKFPASASAVAALACGSETTEHMVSEFMKNQPAEVSVDYNRVFAKAIEYGARLDLVRFLATKFCGQNDYSVYRIIEKLANIRPYRGVLQLLIENGLPAYEECVVKLASYRHTTEEMLVAFLRNIPSGKDEDGQVIKFDYNSMVWRVQPKFRSFLRDLPKATVNSLKTDMHPNHPAIGETCSIC